MTPTLSAQRTWRSDGSRGRLWFPVTAGRAGGAGAAAAILALVLPVVGAWDPSSRDLPKFITKPTVPLFSGLVILWTAVRDPGGG